MIPFVAQTAEGECGAACLAMVLGHFGIRSSLLESIEHCGVSRDGTTAFDLVRAARDLGLQPRGVQVAVSGLRQAMLPAILLWEEHHFVVLEQVDPTGWRICDPRLGRIEVGLEEIAMKYGEVAIVFETNEMTPCRRSRISAMFDRFMAGSRLHASGGMRPESRRAQAYLDMAPAILSRLLWPVIDSTIDVPALSRMRTEAGLDLLHNYLDAWDRSKNRGLTLESDVETGPSDQAVRIDRSGLRGSLGARKIRFAYRRSGPPILDELDLFVKPGERLGILGPGPVGKTTLARILTGRLTASSGSVCHGQGGGVVLLDLVPDSSGSRHVRIERALDDLLTRTTPSLLIVDGDFDHLDRVQRLAMHRRLEGESIGLLCLSSREEVLEGCHRIVHLQRGRLLPLVGAGVL